MSVHSSIRTSTSTVFGRNHDAMLLIPKVCPRGRRVVAWAVGLGAGKNDSNIPSVFRAPFEHLELANALNSCAEDFRVYAMDSDENVVSRARALLKSPRLTIPGSAHSRTERWRNYLRTFSYQPVGPKKAVWAVPQRVRERITILGPSNEGDVFSSMPHERPDLITCFHLAYHYANRGGNILLNLLMRSLKPNGVLLVDDRTARIFHETLSSRMKRMPFSGTRGALPNSVFYVKK